MFEDYLFDRTDLLITRIVNTFKILSLGRTKHSLLIVIGPHLYTSTDRETHHHFDFLFLAIGRAYSRGGRSVLQMHVMDTLGIYIFTMLEMAPLSPLYPKVLVIYGNLLL